MSNYKKYSDLPDDKPKITPSPQREHYQQNQNKQPNECHQIISLEQKNYIINNHKVCVVDVFGEWCGPCQQIADEYFKLSQEYSKHGMCAVVKENVDDGFSPSVTGVPAFIFYFKGNEVDRIVGANMSEVRSKLFELLSRN
jgi:thiol-disulfide isomerase/thioredoxin